MPEHRFTLVLDCDEVSEELADALFAAGCDDGTAGSCDGVASVDFWRDAPSFAEAARDAIGQVQSCGVGVKRLVVTEEQMAALQSPAGAA